jgi:hypothetical protein
MKSRLDYNGLVPALNFVFEPECFGVDAGFIRLVFLGDDDRQANLRD